MISFCQCIVNITVITKRNLYGNLWRIFSSVVKRQTTTNVFYAINKTHHLDWYSDSLYSLDLARPKDQIETLKQKHALSQFKEYRAQYDICYNCWLGALEYKNFYFLEHFRELKSHDVFDDDAYYEANPRNIFTDDFVEMLSQPEYLNLFVPAIKTMEVPNFDGENLR